MIEISGAADSRCLFRIRSTIGVQGFSVQPPRLELDGQWVTAQVQVWSEVTSELVFPGCREHVVEGPVVDQPGLTLRLVYRIADASPVVRLRFEVLSDTPRVMTKCNGSDGLLYAATDLSKYTWIKEVQLSDFHEINHSYGLREMAIERHHFAADLEVMGPLLCAGDDAHSILLAYEHGSMVPDAYLHYKLSISNGFPEATISAVKGNYLKNQVIDAEHPFESPWLQFASVQGDEADLAAAYRSYILDHFSAYTASREPLIFYNTWNYQERLKHQHQKPYLDEMHQSRMEAEIDAAHRMGIDVFVIDTGWYSKTGDWRVNLERFPDGLRSIKRRLDQYGMRLGLWFDNAAAVSSDMLTRYPHCVMNTGTVPKPNPVWETEASHRLCFVSDYWMGFADQLIRLSKELGVTYFKWDAVRQYGCSDPGHLHGGPDDSEAERSDRFSFLLPLYMTKMAERISDSCPEAICDFDMTEPARCFGLAFLSAAKYFLINNGPYYHNFDVPKPGTNNNMMFQPGPARTWLTRRALTLDKWLPSILTLTHYLPDDPYANQVNCVASLVLGHNGMWGDLVKISPEGQGLIGSMIRNYKQVRHDVTKAPLVRTGESGGSPEVYEKINPATGRGVISVFGMRSGPCTYVTQQRVAENVWTTDGMRVERLADGRALIHVAFKSPTGYAESYQPGVYAQLAVFGVDGM